jgi:hypothetical protein
MFQTLQHIQKIDTINVRDRQFVNGMLLYENNLLSCGFKINSRHRQTKHTQTKHSSTIHLITGLV